MSDKSTLTFKARTAIYERLKAVIERDPKDESVCSYRDGHGDASVAAELRCSAHNVRSVRSEMFGHIRSGPRGDAAQTAEQLARHEERLAAHERRLTAVYQLLLRLGADAKLAHLKELRALREAWDETPPTARG